MATVREPQFLGSGWRFPLQVTARGTIARSSRERRVEESIYLILATARGERVMRPDFGCGIHDLVFESNNAMTRSRIVDDVRNALLEYEPRIDVLTVEATSTPEEPNLVLIRVDYQIRSTNSAQNLVYPFYLSEGP